MTNQNPTSAAAPAENTETPSHLIKIGGREFFNMTSGDNRIEFSDPAVQHKLQGLAKQLAEIEMRTGRKFDEMITIGGPYDYRISLYNGVDQPGVLSVGTYGWLDEKPEITEGILLHEMGHHSTGNAAHVHLLEMNAISVGFLDAVSQFIHDEPARAQGWMIEKFGSANAAQAYIDRVAGIAQKVSVALAPLKGKNDQEIATLLKEKPTMLQNAAASLDATAIIPLVMDDEHPLMALMSDAYIQNTTFRQNLIAQNPQISAELNEDQPLRDFAPAAEDGEFTHLSETVQTYRGGLADAFGTVHAARRADEYLADDYAFLHTQNADAYISVLGELEAVEALAQGEFDQAQAMFGMNGATHPKIENRIERGRENIANQQSLSQQQQQRQFMPDSVERAAAQTLHAHPFDTMSNHDISTENADAFDTKGPSDYLYGWPKNLSIFDLTIEERKPAATEQVAEFQRNSVRQAAIERINFFQDALAERGIQVRMGAELEFVPLNEQGLPEANLLNEKALTRQLQQSIPTIERVHREPGSQAGYELVTGPNRRMPGTGLADASPLATADTIAAFKDAAQANANRWGLGGVSFDPVVKAAGITEKNGTHLNMSLWSADSSQNLFYEAGGKTSDLERHVIDALIRTHAEGAAAYLPHADSYARLAPTRIGGLDYATLINATSGAPNRAGHMPNKGADLRYTIDQIQSAMITQELPINSVASRYGGGKIERAIGVLDRLQHGPNRSSMIGWEKPHQHRIESRLAGADVDPYVLVAVELGAAYEAVTEHVRSYQPGQQIDTAEEKIIDVGDKKFIVDIHSGGFDSIPLPRDITAARNQMAGSERLQNLLGDNLYHGIISYTDPANHPDRVAAQDSSDMLGTMRSKLASGDYQVATLDEPVIEHVISPDELPPHIAAAHDAWLAEHGASAAAEEEQFMAAQRENEARVTRVLDTARQYASRHSTVASPEITPVAATVQAALDIAESPVRAPQERGFKTPWWGKAIAGINRITGRSSLERELASAIRVRYDDLHPAEPSPAPEQSPATPDVKPTFQEQRISPYRARQNRADIAKSGGIMPLRDLGRILTQDTSDLARIARVSPAELTDMDSLARHATILRNNDIELPEQWARITLSLEDMGFTHAALEATGSVAQVFRVIPKDMSEPADEIRLRVVGKRAEEAARKNPGGAWVKAPEILQRLAGHEIQIGSQTGHEITNLNYNYMAELFPTVGTEGVRGAHANTLNWRLWARGLRWADTSDTNVGFLLDGTPVVLDAGEVTRVRSPGKMVQNLGLVASPIIGLGQLSNPAHTWDFEKQRAGLTRDWGAYVAENLANAPTHSREEVEALVKEFGGVPRAEREELLRQIYEEMQARRERSAERQSPSIGNGPIVGDKIPSEEKPAVSAGEQSTLSLPDRAPVATENAESPITPSSGKTPTFQEQKISAFRAALRSSTILAAPFNMGVFSEMESYHDPERTGRKWLKDFGSEPWHSSARTLEEKTGLRGIAGHYRLPEGMTRDDLKAFEHQEHPYFSSYMDGMRVGNSSEFSSLQAFNRTGVDRLPLAVNMIHQIQALNPELRNIQFNMFDREQVSHVLMGIMYDFNPNDIQYFVHQDRNPAYRNAEWESLYDAVSTVSKPTYVASPDTLLDVIERHPDARAKADELGIDIGAVRTRLNANTIPMGESQSAQRAMVDAPIRISTEPAASAISTENAEHTQPLFEPREDLYWWAHGYDHPQYPSINNPRSVATKALLLGSTAMTAPIILPDSVDSALTPAKPIVTGEPVTDFHIQGRPETPSPRAPVAPHGGIVHTSVGSGAGAGMSAAFAALRYIPGGSMDTAHMVGGNQLAAEIDASRSDIAGIVPDATFIATAGLARIAPKVAPALAPGLQAVAANGARVLGPVSMLAAAGVTYAEMRAAAAAQDGRRQAGALYGLLGGLASGAATGAAGGSLGGPWGALIGGTGGALAGGFLATEYGRRSHMGDQMQRDLDHQAQIAVDTSVDRLREIRNATLSGKPLSDIEKRDVRAIYVAMVEQHTRLEVLYVPETDIDGHLRRNFQLNQTAKAIHFLEDPNANPFDLPRTSRQVGQAASSRLPTLVAQLNARDGELHWKQWLDQDRFGKKDGIVTVAEVVKAAHEYGLDLYTLDKNGKGLALDELLSALHAVGVDSNGVRNGRSFTLNTAPLIADSVHSSFTGRPGSLHLLETLDALHIPGLNGQQLRGVMDQYGISVAMLDLKAEGKITEGDVARALLTNGVPREMLNGLADDIINLVPRYKEGQQEWPAANARLDTLRATLKDYTLNYGKDATVDNERWAQSRGIALNYLSDDGTRDDARFRLTRFGINIITPEDMAKIGMLPFMDTNHDGKIDMDNEAAPWLAAHKIIFTDTNQNGRIDLDEFVAALPTDVRSKVDAAKARPPETLATTPTAEPEVEEIVVTAPRRHPQGKLPQSR